MAERRLRGVQLAARLYRQVETQVPALLPLAGRAKAGIEEQFVRYGRLEERHAWQLQQVYRAVAQTVMLQRRGRGDRAGAALDRRLSSSPQPSAARPVSSSRLRPASAGPARAGASA